VIVARWMFSACCIGASTGDLQFLSKWEGYGFVYNKGEGVFNVNTWHLASAGTTIKKRCQ